MFTTRLDRRQLFGVALAAVTSFVTGLTAPKKIPVPVNPIPISIYCHTIINAHRQTIIDAFDSDLYASNALDIQHQPIYETWTKIEDAATHERLRAWLDRGDDNNFSKSF